MPVELTVIVKDSDGKLFDGANVTVNPGEFTAKTNSKGEASLSIDGAERYEVEVEAGESSQTVPFYPSRDQGEARLEVNLQYFEQLEKADREEAGSQTEEVASAPWYQVPHEQSGYLLAGAIIILVLAVALMRSARKKRERAELKETKKVSSVKKPSEAKKKPAKK